MAVKIFCSACHNFIKDATKNEIRTATGEEICEDCQQKVGNALEEINKSARRSIVQIEGARDRAKADLERIYKKVIKADE